MVGQADQALSIQVTSIIAQIELLDEQIIRVETEITEIMCFNYSVIMTMPGHRLPQWRDDPCHNSPFLRSKKLLSFADLDSSIYQSGNFSAKRIRISKCSFRVPRYALLNAAHNVVKNNAAFNTYYDKKMAERQTHHNVLRHCDGKLVMGIWKMLTDEVVLTSIKRSVY